MKLRLVPVLVAGIVLLGLAGCETIGYYGQAFSGQLSILARRQRIDNLITDPGTSDQLRHKLETVRDLREFGSEALGLPAGGQFRHYADIGRDYVVWNVFAAPEFSMRPRSWCYPVAGCVSYRGYFSRQAARDKAQELQQAGMDVHVGGVTAYSTLGWFSDPILNTVIGRDDVQLARLIFHELAHQVVYVPGDTRFNESFATTVELEGLRRWIMQVRAPESSDTLLANIEGQMQQREAFVALVRQAVADLKMLYRQTLAPADMRQRKAQRMTQLKQEHAALREQWGGDSPYDGWFANELNNARLLTVTTYNSLVPAFRQVLRNCEDDMPCFYERVGDIAALDDTARRAALERLGGIPAAPGASRSLLR